MEQPITKRASTLKNEILKGIEDLQSLLQNIKDVLLITHTNPDGDAIGSTMGLYHYLKKKGHSVTAMTPNDFPGFLSWIKESNEIVVFQNQQKKALDAIEKAELIICVDFNEFKRLKDLGPKLEAAKAAKALIDHHPEPDNGYAAKIHSTKSSSTAELIFRYISVVGDEELIDATVAECIYTGIMTDTGCFSHNSSNPETFRAVATLLSKGFSKDQVFHEVYDNFSQQRMKLMGYCLNEKMVVLPQYNAAYISITQEEMERYHFKTGDSEGFVNLPFSIKGVYITALFTEKKDHIRVSFRSKGGFAINEMAQKYFEGGGHLNAAGGESKLSMKETLDKFENLLELYKDEIKKRYN